MAFSGPLMPVLDSVNEACSLGKNSHDKSVPRKYVAMTRAGIAASIQAVATGSDTPPDTRPSGWPSDPTTAFRLGSTGSFGYRCGIRHVIQALLHPPGQVAIQEAVTQPDPSYQRQRGTGVVNLLILPAGQTLCGMCPPRLVAKEMIPGRSNSPVQWGSRRSQRGPSDTVAITHMQSDQRGAGWQSATRYNRQDASRSRHGVRAGAPGGPVLRTRKAPCPATQATDTMWATM